MDKGQVEDGASLQGTSWGWSLSIRDRLDGSFVHCRKVAFFTKTNILIRSSFRKVYNRMFCVCVGQVLNNYSCLNGQYGQLACTNIYSA